MGAEDLIPLGVYGLLVVLVLLGGIFGPPVVLLVAVGLAVLWVVMLRGKLRASRRGAESRR